MFGHCEKCDYVWCKCDGPAPKEEVMEHIDQMYAEIRASANELRTAERHARFERAYMAALGGYCASGNAENEYTAVTFSRETALETVRQWDEMMAELDGEEG